MGPGLYVTVCFIADIPPLSTRCKYSKLTTMHNIVPNHFIILLMCNEHDFFPYNYTHHHVNFVRPFTCNHYMHSSFVPV